MPGTKTLTRLLTLLPLLVLSAGPAPALALRPGRAGGADVFGGREGCFILHEGGGPALLERTGTLCAERLSPCSTFKIPNSLFGLESGVVADADFVIPWDGVKRDREEWNRDHTLASAFEVSAVWYYRELARRVGATRMKTYLDAVGYGNRDMSSGIDVFWLGRSLTISPDEQVTFLDRLRRSKLPFSERSQRIVRDILVRERPGSLVYRGKTGSCGGDGAPDHGWWVGWVERDGEATLFAMLIRGKGASGLEARRLAELQLRERHLLGP